MRQRKRVAAGGVLAEKQERYVRLISQVVGNSEACRLVGINRKTGNRWRYGRSVRNSAGELVQYPPVTITPAKPRSPRYLSEDADHDRRSTRRRQDGPCDRDRARPCAVNGEQGGAPQR